MNEIIRIGIANVHRLREQLKTARTDAEVLDIYERLNNLMHCVIDEFSRQYGERKGDRNV